MATDPVTLNRPGAPTNTPQHVLEEVPVPPPPHKPGVADRGDASAQTGPGTAPVDDVADPHPADEGHPDAGRRPGGANPPAPDADLGPNPERHDGEPPPPPDNARREPGWGP